MMEKVQWANGLVFLFFVTDRFLRHEELEHTVLTIHIKYDMPS